LKDVSLKKNKATEHLLELTENTAVAGAQWGGGGDLGPSNHI